MALLGWHATNDNNFKHDPPSAAGSAKEGTSNLLLDPSIVGFRTSEVWKHVMAPAVSNAGLQACLKEVVGEEMGGEVGWVAAVGKRP